MYRVLSRLCLTFYYQRKRRISSRNYGPLICSSTSSCNTLQILIRVVEESGVDEQELGKTELDKLLLDKLQVGFDHVKLPGRIGFSLGYSPEDYGFLDSCFGSESFDSDCFDFDFC
uniref:Uncharacterized protein n=1 Tax=Tanacetum cinerariifolium TaxID=118510 RepID=A0A699T8H6_TANCI|nr:hypothetical protein [Tanacetum cinerariifolium]